MNETDQKPAQTPAAGGDGQPPQAPQKAVQQAQDPQEALNRELERLRAGNRRLKVVAGTLAVIFIVAAAAGYMVYRKIVAVTEPMADAFRTFQAQPVPGAVSGQNALPAMPGTPGGQGAPQAGASSPGGSSLGLFSGGLPGSGADAAGADPAVAQANARRAMLALGKYMKRPIVKRFLADLRRDPAVAAALGNKKNVNPIALVAAVRSSRYLNSLIMKYSTDPAFIQTMTEIASDPDIRAIAGSLPPGAMPQFPGAPGAAPQAVARPMDVQQAPAAQNAGSPEYDEGMTVDQSALGGGSSGGASGDKGVPSPVDSQ